LASFCEKPCRRARRRQQRGRFPKFCEIEARDKTHLKFVASQPCLICGRQPSDPHHLRFAQPRGIGLKVSDEFTVPLCRGHHRQLHQAGNEVTWWENFQIDALAMAKDLWKQTHTKDGRVDPQTQSTPIDTGETTAKN